MHLFHINDVIAHNDYSRNRLQIQYRCICEHLGLPEPEIHYIASRYGDSGHTAQQIVRLIHHIQNDPTRTQNKCVILANNANRAKFINTGNAKGSPCYRATIHGPHHIHIVGTDHYVFAGIQKHIDKLRIIHDITLNRTTKIDISQGSQFRSLEYFPIAQCLIQQYDDPTPYLHTEITDPNTLPTDTKVITDITQTDTNRLTNIHHIRPTKTITHSSLSTHNDLRDIQIIGQAHQYYHDRNITPNPKIIQDLTYPRASYQQKLQELQDNQLLLIDRDHFGNTKCLSKHPNGIYGIAKACDIPIGQSVTIQRTDNDTHHTDQAYLVESISDKTTHKCIRNGSSRGPHNHHLIECNRSIGTDRQVRDEIQSLPLGTIFAIQA